MSPPLLFPEIQPYRTSLLKVSALHTVYFEECGNPKGIPVIFLHGGPGGGLHEDYRRFFDPQFYRIILFDQRGSGQSTPHAELRENTTWDLVSDIEKIRTELQVPKWLVFGGSWGSTLALAYASKHAVSISGMVLRGIFLCRKKEIDWFYQYGAHAIFPEAWERYESLIPQNERADYVSAYHRRLTGPNPDIRLQAAREWSQWEASCSKLHIDPQYIDQYEDAHKALAFARIECHYFTNGAFFVTDNYLIESVPQFRSVPTVIVQGRYDMVCPIMTAWELHRAWPEAELRIIPDAGHSIAEPGIAQALVEATNEFKIRLSQ